jgi:hypothetical protein
MLTSQAPQPTSFIEALVRRWMTRHSSSDEESTTVRVMRIPVSRHTGLTMLTCTRSRVA